MSSAEKVAGAPAEFADFVAHGWHVQGPEHKATGQFSMQQPGSQAEVDVLECGSSQAAKDLGIIEDSTACICWCRPPELSSSTDDDGLQSVQIALRHAMAAVAASRIAACALQHSGWCIAALQTLETMMTQLKASTKEADSWPDGGAQSPAAIALKAAVSALEEPFHTCLEILDDFRPPEANKVDAESVVFLIANLDSMYYVLLDHHLTAPWTTPSVPPPHKYFPALLDLMKPEVEAAVSSLVQYAGPVAADAFRQAWGLSKENQLEAEADPLRQVMWARWQEAAVLLYHRGLGAAGEMDQAAEEEAGFREWVANRGKSDPDDATAVGVGHGLVDVPEDSVEDSGDVAIGSAKPGAQIGGMSEDEFDQAMKIALGAADGSDDEDDSGQLAQEARIGADADGVKPAPPAHMALQVFRDSARAWACHLYAFAAPNAAAIAALAATGPILEVGAGVGYWAHLLREAGATVVATDELPTSQCDSENVNQYHGRVPSWTHIEKAMSSCTADYSDHTLFLCYPPPASKMAEEALAAYTGDTVALVGEWDGDTGTHDFSEVLLMGWTLQEAIPLPNWSDTAHDLTIWRRRPESLQADRLDAVPWPLCSGTGNTLGQCLQGEGRAFKRCRYLRSLQYCNENAWEKHRQVASGLMALSFVLFKRTLSFDSSMDFEDVSILTKRANV
eukprot:jgi/Ulvmu1/286/UM001_0290.1